MVLQKIKDLGAYWFLGNREDTPLDSCLKQAKALNHNFIVACDYYQEGMIRPSKIYASYKNSKLFYKNTKNISSEQRHFYVIVPENTKCCLYADLEWYIDWKSIDQIKDKFIQVVTDTFKNKSDIELKPADFLFANASKGNKGSLHAHVPSVCFNNVDDQKRFFNSVYDTLDKESNDWFFIDESNKSYILKTFIDFGVYNKNRQLRLPYSSKMETQGDNIGVGKRPLIPDNQEDFDFRQWTIIDLDECDDPIDVSSYPSEITCSKRQVWSKELVQSVIDDLNLDVDVSTFKGQNLISLRNKKNVRICPINGEENKSDNAFLVIKDNQLHYYCHDDGCKGQSKIIHQFEQDDRIVTQKLVDECIEGGHSDCAELFKHIYGNNVFIICKKEVIFYHWNKQTRLWENEISVTLLGLINSQLKPLFEQEAKKIYNKMLTLNNKEKDKSQEAILNSKLKKIQKLLNNIKSTSFLNNVIKYYSSFSINKDFESKIINKVKDHLPIKDGQIINLRTLEVRTRTKKDFWSVECPVKYDPTLDLTDVHNFMDSITCNSLELKDYHRRFWGYMLTGEISDRSLHIFWGNGCNGKSSIVNIFKNILGEVFATSLSEDVMVGQKTSRGASPEMMDLLFARCGVMPESDKREKINSKRVKVITGDDDIKARHLYGHLVQFRTQCKTIWPTNHKPTIDVEDQAIIDRLKLIPFLARFEKNDKNTAYIKYLQEECLNQFFTWFCSGVKDWYDGQSLKPCKEMNEEMNKYIAECDVIAEFIDDTYDIVSEMEYENLSQKEKSKYRTERGEVYAMFCAWLSENNKKNENMSKKEFYKALSNKYSVKNNKNRYYCLLIIKNLCDGKEQDKICSGLPPL